MKVPWKLVVRSLPAGFLMIALAGCGGVSASHSVSPASMLIPGLIHAPVDVPAETPAPLDFEEGIESSSIHLVSN